MKCSGLQFPSLLATFMKDDMQAKRKLIPTFLIPKLVLQARKHEWPDLKPSVKVP